MWAEWEWEPELGMDKWTWSNEQGWNMLWWIMGNKVGPAQLQQKTPLGSGLEGRWDKDARLGAGRALHRRDRVDGRSTGTTGGVRRPEFWSRLCHHQLWESFQSSESSSGPHDNFCGPLVHMSFVGPFLLKTFWKIVFYECIRIKMNTLISHTESFFQPKSWFFS